MATDGENDKEISGISNSDCVYEYICQPCSEDGLNNEAHGFCVDCVDFLCKRCFECHTVPRATRKHVLLDKHQMVSQSSVNIIKPDKCTVLCKIHIGKRVKYHCITHSYVGCSACVISDHRTCISVVNISDVSMCIKETEQYKRYKASLKELDASSKAIRKKTQEKKTLVQVSSSKLVADIEAFSQKSIDTIKLHTNELIEEVNRSIEQKEQTIDTVSSKLDSTSRKIQSLSDKTKHLEKDHKFCNLYVEMVQQGETLTQLFRELSSTLNDCRCADELSYMPNNELSAVLAKTNCIGYLGNPDDDITTTTTTITAASATELVKEMSCVYMRDFNAEAPSDNNRCSFTGSVFIPDKTLILVDNFNKSLKLINTSTSTVTSTFIFPNKPWSVAKVNNKQVVVTIPDLQQICFMETTPSLIVEKKIATNGSCRDIAVSGKKLIVLFNLKIEILDIQGNALKRIDKDPEGASLFNYGLHLSLNPHNNLIYVCGYSNNGVLGISLNGTVVSKFLISQLLKPWQGAFDKNNNYFVCGSASNNLLYITRDWKHTKVLLSEKDGLKSPQTLSFDETRGFLYIGCFDKNNIKVFKLRS